MDTYRQLLRTPEFTPLFAATLAQNTALVVSGLALGTRVFATTGSPMLSALAMFGPSLAQLFGAATLLSAADRLPPRAALCGLALVFAVGTASQAMPGLPLWGSFGLLAVLGACGSLGGGVRYGLLNELLPQGSYLLGRSLLALSDGATQICGFAAGGVLLAVLSPQGVLLTGAGLYALSAVTARLGLARRIARATGRPSPLAIWRANRLLWSASSRRHVYLALWVPPGLVVGCESLYVPYAPRYAGFLFACGALGMLCGDLAVARLVPTRCKQRLVVPLCLLLALPYLVFAARPPLVWAAAAVLVATAGYGAGLLLQERLVGLAPRELSGHALGLHSSGMLTAQGVFAALAGLLAEGTSPAAAMAVLAGVSAGTTLLLAPGLRRAVPQPPA
ncbi:hypothetical protein [Streptomyces sulphureus]|uniref:hypothetical protein n=1 Tax=Streptomyces sulphureus TaxID=47758 RepID=UPI0003759BD5|nr:hypothetical protein [Streptomyces sulphureus]